MNLDYKERWLKALRSGNYLQGRRFLRQQDENGRDRSCVMGVLADVAGLRGMGSGSYLQSDALKKVGLMESQQRLLANLNDHGATFEEIADVIERDLEHEASLTFEVAHLIAKIRLNSRRQRQVLMGELY